MKDAGYDTRVVITGIGLTAPGANDLNSFRANLLQGRSGVRQIDVRYLGPVLAGICDFDEQKHQTRKDRRRGTRAGSIAIYCANEAVRHSALNWPQQDKSRVGVYVGITEHGNVETENEIFSLEAYKGDTKFWSHHHNPRTVANNPAGEVTLNMGVHGPHYCIGAACAAGNIGIIQAVQMLRLKEVDVAIAGGVSESTSTFVIFASFKSQGALAWHDDPTKGSRPFDRDRNGIVVSEGGCMYTLERLEDALSRNAPIFGEIAGYAINSDALDFVLPSSERQEQCMASALRMAGLTPNDIDIINTHATGTPLGDIQECGAIARLFKNCESVHINNTKSLIGHAMGAAGALELTGNLPAFTDNLVHPTINVDNLDPQCALPNLILNQPRELKSVELILNNSAGMLGINSTLIVKKPRF